MVHRDISIRNLLLGKQSEVKLCNFGQAQRVSRKLGIAHLPRAGKLPALYMPPEGFLEDIATQESDVWASGVAMWEMMAYVFLLVVILF